MLDGVLTQDDLDSMDLFELSKEFSERSLQIVRYLGVDHQRDLIAELGGQGREKLTANLETDCRQRLDPP